MGSARASLYQSDPKPTKGLTARLTAAQMYINDTLPLKSVTDDGCMLTIIKGCLEAASLGEDIKLVLNPVFLRK